MWKMNATVAICEDHQSVQKGVQALEKSGCSLKKMSVLGRDCYSADHPSAEDMGAEAHKQCSKTVSLWCKLWGRLSGDAFLNIDGIGSVLVAGPLAPRLISMWADPVTNDAQDALNAGLDSLGLSQEGIAECEAALRSNRYVVVLCGNPSEVARAKGILETPDASRPRQARRSA